MKKIVVTAFALATVAAMLAATAGAGPSASSAATQAVRCNSTIKIAFPTPLTGDAGFLGNEQLSWARYAVKRLAPQLGLKIRLIPADTQLDPALASTLAQRHVADRAIMAIIGPSTSGAVAATSRTYFQAKLAHISPSATRTSLTKAVGGQPKEATPAFFRVVADDGIQGPYDARFMIEKLRADKVVVVDSQEPYSVGLADAVQAYLRGKGVTVQRESVSINTTDFSSVVTRVPNDADIVFFGTQQPPKAQTFAQQLLEQGKRAKLFSGDGANNPEQFRVPGSYVSNFAGPIDAFAYNRQLIAGWKRDNPRSEVGSFGPPSYGAVQVALLAIKRACTAKKNGSITRQDVLRQVKRVRVKNWILGGDFRFSTKTNDPLNGKFYIFEVQSNGSYKLVG
jgi:branched-chain amino acid transport system substrate-binding protein